MKYKYIFLIAVSFFAVSCNFTGKLTRRYKVIEQKPTSEIAKYVEVDAYSIEKEKQDPVKPRTLFDLSPQGQKALINQAGFNESANDKLISALTSNLSAKANNSIEWIDFTKVEKRIVVSVKNLQHWPADRISKTSIKIKFGDDIKLLSCNKLITEYQNLDLGKLNYSNSNQFEIAGNATTGLNVVNANSGLSEQTTSDKIDNLSSSGKNNTTNNTSNTSSRSQGLTSKFSASRTFAEEVLLKQRIVALNASISKNTLTLYQESISGIDLTGNIIADIVFESKEDVNVVKVYSFLDLTTKDGINSPDKLTIKEILVSFFNFQKDVEAIISYDVDYRHVKAGQGDRTITESDDRIELLYGSSTKTEPVVLIPQNQLRPKLWILHLKDDKTRMPMKIKSPTAGGSGELIFNSYTEAKEFITWLKLKKTEVVTAKGALGPLGHIIFTPSDTQIDNSTIDGLVIGAEGVKLEDGKKEKDKNSQMKKDSVNEGI